MHQTHHVGDTFTIQLVWRAPDDDYLRAFFEAEVTAIIEGAMKYMVVLSKLLGGRQETPERKVRTVEAMTGPLWKLIADLRGRKITVAWEVTDGSPIYLRLATLTGEHDFFTRYNQPALDLPPEMLEQLTRRIEENEEESNQDE